MPIAAFVNVKWFVFRNVAETFHLFKVIFPLSPGISFPDLLKTVIRLFSKTTYWLFPDSNYK